MFLKSFTRKVSEIIMDTQKIFKIYYKTSHTYLLQYKKKKIE